MIVHFISINFFSIPLTKHIEAYFSSFNRVRKIFIHHNIIENPLVFSSKSIISPVIQFSSYEQYLRDNERLSIKVKKYFKVFLKLFLSLFNPSPKIYYTIDFQIVPFLILFKLLSLGRVKSCIYHEFELVNPNSQLGINKLFFRLYAFTVRWMDVIILPEKNRIQFFMRNVRGNPSVMLFPNTTTIFNRINIYEELTPSLNLDGKFVIGHVGNFGENQYFRQIIEVIEKLKSLDSSIIFLFVGGNKKLLTQAVREYNLDNLIIIDKVPHEKLYTYYHLMHAGLILYKDINLNYRYCAPNKLYEYWSFGIPVIAHRLDGLEGIVDDPYKGKLGNLEEINEFSDLLLEYKSRLHKASDKSRLLHFFREEVSIDKYLSKLGKKLGLE